MKIVFATNTTRQANQVLNDVGADVRLLSYWYLKTLPPTFLRDYVANGLGPEPKEKANGGKKKRVKLEQD